MVKIKKVSGMPVITSWKALLVPAVLLLLFSLAIIGSHWSATGSFIGKSIDFTGGSRAEIPLPEGADAAEAERVLRAGAPDAAIRVTVDSQGRQTLVVDSKEELTETLIAEGLEGIGIVIDKEGVSLQSVGAALGTTFLAEAQKALLIAFLLMAAVIFVTFRSVVPSLAVILAAVSDILFAVAMMNLFSIDLSLGTLAGLLMLLGFSVDTDILLTTRMVKRQEGSLNERVASAMKTGVTMTTTGIAAFIVLWLVSSSQMLDSIALVIIFGLLADYITTWCQNVGILRWHLGRRK